MAREEREDQCVASAVDVAVEEEAEDTIVVAAQDATTEETMVARAVRTKSAVEARKEQAARSNTVVAAEVTRERATRRITVMRTPPRTLPPLLLSTTSLTASPQFRHPPSCVNILGEETVPCIVNIFPQKKQKGYTTLVYKRIMQGCFS